MVKNVFSKDRYLLISKIIEGLNPNKALIMGCGQGEEVFIFNYFYNVECYGYDTEDNIKYCQYKEIYGKLSDKLQYNDFDLVIESSVNENNIDTTLKNLQNITSKYAIITIGKTEKSIDWWRWQFSKYFGIIKLDMKSSKILVGEKI